MTTSAGMGTQWLIVGLINDYLVDETYYLDRYISLLLLCLYHTSIYN